MVLAVDDDDFMRDLLQRTFTTAKLGFKTFVSAQDLLAHADLQSPAVLLLDVRMPEVSGLKLQTLLRERGVLLPIMFLAGSSDIAMAVTAMRNGAVDFVEKPFDAADLVARLRRAFAVHVSTPARPGRSATSAHAGRLAALTAREHEVYDRMVLGMTSKEIAEELGGSFRTIEIHRSRVLVKMGASNVANLVRRSLIAVEGQ
ncbi:response regulator transcription factor [Variovorax sp. RA8]|uniref:response regulator transcription factor n=1 Tax=Variovorax sp. (strain JCM 16519 / RA8) TaxID=662548 RepID=UPI000A938A58|nr:response regulator [Variovorax sp. RA8]VTU29486.1 Transcriptional regulatory protein TdiR [Variovorax sp. RA8]